MKHLLLIANLSIDNKYLLEYASKYCEHYGCKLHVLHVDHYSEPILVSSAKYYDENDIEFLESQQEKAANEIAKKVSNVLDVDFVQVTIQKGNQEQILNSFLSDNFIDLIIIGNNDIEKASDFQDHKNILLNVIDTPLLIVPDLEVFSPLNVFNFLTAYTEKDIENIILLSNFFSESRILISHMLQEMDESKVKVEKWKLYLKSKIDNKIEFLDVEEEVRDYVRRENFSTVKMYDAFVFTAKKRNFWKRLIDPSTTLSYLAGLEMPSIVFKVQ